MKKEKNYSGFFDKFMPFNWWEFYRPDFSKGFEMKKENMTLVKTKFMTKKKAFEYSTINGLIFSIE